MRLYDIAQEYLHLMELAEDPDTDADALEEAMRDAQDALEDKADNYGKIINTLKAEANAADEEIKRLQKRKAALSGNADRLKDSLQAAMAATGQRKIKTALFTFGIQKNPPKVVLDSDVPDEYLIPQPPKVDTSGIMAALKNGEELGFAHLEQGESLRIR